MTLDEDEATRCGDLFAGRARRRPRNEATSWKTRQISDMRLSHPATMGFPPSSPALASSQYAAGREVALTLLFLFLTLRTWVLSRAAPQLELRFSIEILLPHRV